MNRAERRRQLKEDDKRITRGFDARVPAGRQIVALMRALDRKMQLALQRRSVGPLMEFVYSNIGSGSRLIGDVPIACGRGCSHCCHSWVDASPAEVLFAVEAMPTAQRARAAQAVEQMYGKTAGQGVEARTAMVTPCPLLEDNVCSVYAARPIVCRSAVSADAGACKRSFVDLSGESIPVPTVWRTLGQGYAVALAGVILKSGLVPTAREWNESLRVALSDPTAEARWFAGEDVFGGLTRASTSGTFDQPAWAELYKEAFGSLPPALD